MKNHSFPRRLNTAIRVDALVGGLQASHPEADGAIKLQGNPRALIDSIANPTDAEPGSLIFCRANDPAQLHAIFTSTRASVIFAPSNTPLQVSLGSERAVIVSPDPLANFIRAIGLFDLAPPRLAALPPAEVTASETHIAPSAKIAERVTIGEQSLVGSGTTIGTGTIIGRFCRIGANVTIGQNCSLEDGTVVGNGAFIQHQVVIGSLALGYHFTATGERLQFPHLGIAIIGEQAVIGPGSVVARGQLDDTCLGRGVRLSNLVSIAHNVKIDDDSVLSSGVLVAGGTSIGARCNIGIGAMVNAKIRLGNDCQIGMGTVVTKSLCDGAKVVGNPARPLPTMAQF